MDSNDSSSDYAVELQAAQNANLSGLEGKRIVQVVWDDDDFPAEDKCGNWLVMVSPSLIKRSHESWEQAFQLFLRESNEVSFSTVLIYHQYSLIPMSIMSSQNDLQMTFDFD